MASKKIVVKLNVHDDQGKKRSMKAVSSIRGIDSISMDMKEGNLTITGDVDPVDIIYKLRKIVEAQIVSVGPAKEPEKENKDDKKEKPEKNDQVCELVRAYREYNPCMTKIYVVHSIEEDPNACVIC